MGFFDKFRNKDRMEKIRQSGRDGEEQFRRDNMFSDIKRKHHGKDFEEHTTDWTGKTTKTSWEVKRNKSPLSKKQMRTRNLHVRRYVDTGYGMVESRTEDKHGNRLEQNMLSGKWEKVKKQDYSGLFSSSSSSKPKKKSSSSTKKRRTSRKKSDSIWGSSSSTSSLFGSSSPRKKKRSSSTKKRRTSRKKSDSIW